MTRRVRHALVAVVATAIACGVLAVASTLAPPTLVTAVPTGPPPPPPGGEAGPLETEALGPSFVPPTGGNADNGLLTGILGVLGTILAVAAGILLVILAIRVARAVAARATATPIDDVVEAPPVDAEAVQDVLRRAREQIDLDDDANRAVIRCWESLEALGAAAGVERDASETAAEYVVDMLASVSAPADAAEDLSRLYARALFSSQRLAADDVARARDCLTRLESSLGEHVRRQREAADA